MKCLVCNNVIHQNRCNICNYLNPSTFDKEPSEEELKRAEEYRKKWLPPVKNVTLSLHMYSIKQSASSQKYLLSRGGRSYVIAAKVDVINKPYWSKLTLVQDKEKCGKKQSITVRYELNGTAKEQSVDIYPRLCDGFWRIGVILHDNQTMSIILGTKSDYTESKPIQLMPDVNTSKVNAG